MSNTANLGHVSASGKHANAVNPLRILGLTAAAVGLNLVALWIGAAAGASLQVAAPEPINAMTVVIMTAAPLLLAGAVVWLLARRFPVRRLAGWVGLIFALVTSAGSFLASADVATALTLMSMHVVAGLAWFIALRPWAR